MHESGMFRSTRRDPTFFEVCLAHILGDAQDFVVVLSHCFLLLVAASGCYARWRVGSLLVAAPAPATPKVGCCRTLERRWCHAWARCCSCCRGWW
jgi:hypothetical protein